MNSLVRFLGKLDVLEGDLEYHLVLASMVIVFLFFGYQKWLEYEAHGLVPYISHGPLIFWMRCNLISWEFRNGWTGRIPSSFWLYSSYSS